MKKSILPLLFMCISGMAQAQTAETDLKYYNMRFSLNPEEKVLSAENKIHFNVTANVKSPVTFDLNNCFDITEIKSLSAAKKLKYEHKDNKLTIFPPVSWNDKDSISVRYKSNSEYGNGDGITYSQHNGAPIVWTMTCPYAGGEWFVCKQDNRDKIDSITVSAECPQKYKTASNGLLISNTEKDGKRIMTWHHRYPIDYYLICLACTNYEIYSDFADLDDGSRVEILNMVYPEYLKEAKIESQKLIPVFQLYCNLFGKYPFAGEKYGQAQFGWGGGMEHQTMTFVNSFDINLTAHELSHQWFGDNITCNTWNEVWLNESFATYCEYLTTEKGLMNEPHNWMKKTNYYATSQSDGKIYVDYAQDFYAIFNYATSYCKGALMLHQLRQFIGNEAFMKAMKSYATDPKLQYKTSKAADYISHVNAAAGQDMTWLFNQWLYQKGYPVYLVEWSNTANGIQLNISQKSSANNDNVFKMMIPVQITGTYPNEVETVWIFNDSKNQTIDIPSKFTVSKIAIDPGHETITKQPVIIKK